MMVSRIANKLNVNQTLSNKNVLKINLITASITITNAGLASR